MVICVPVAQRVWAAKFIHTLLLIHSAAPRLVLTLVTSSLSLPLKYSQGVIPWPASGYDTCPHCRKPQLDTWSGKQDPPSLQSMAKIKKKKKAYNSMTIRTALSQLVTRISNCNLSGDGCLTTSCLVLISMSFHSRFTFFKKLIPKQKCI